MQNLRQWQYSTRCYLLSRLTQLVLRDEDRECNVCNVDLLYVAFSQLTVRFF